MCSGTVIIDITSKTALSDEIKLSISRLSPFRELYILHVYNVFFITYNLEIRGCRRVWKAEEWDEGADTHSDILCQCCHRGSWIILVPSKIFHAFQDFAFLQKK